MDNYHFIRSIFFAILLLALIFILVQKSFRFFRDFDYDLLVYRWSLFKQWWYYKAVRKMRDFIYKDNTKSFQSQTTNPTVLNLYEFIMQNEAYHSEFWYDGQGSDELAHILNHYFSPDDWIDLKKDLTFWTNEQLEIFSYAFLIFYDTESNKLKENEALFEEETNNIYQRFLLIEPLIEIAFKRGAQHTEIRNHITENLDFIETHYDRLLKSDPKIGAHILRIILAINHENNPMVKRLLLCIKNQ